MSSASSSNTASASLPVQAHALFSEFEAGGLLNAKQGPDTTIKGIQSRDGCGPGDLVFVDKAGDVAAVIAKSPAAIVLPAEAMAEYSSDSVCLLAATNVGMAHALIRQRYHAPDPRASEWGDRHPSAIIHETAQLDDSVMVGPRAVIGADVRIGAGSVIMAGVIIERAAVLGENCVIQPNVFIGYECQLGARVIVQPGSVIGSEGYGYAQNDKGRSFRVPQTGTVVLEDDVEIGAANCMDRATYGETRIKRGTKFDNFCHVAHNVTIGEDCLITAGFIVAGSTNIGNRVIASGQTGILDHLTVADDVILVHRAAVIESIEKPGIYAGNPAQPLAPYLKNTAILRNLNDLRKKVSALERASK